jgi:hypothetical protein
MRDSGASLALVTCFDIPADVFMNGWLPELVSYGSVGGVDASVTKFVMSFFENAVAVWTGKDDESGVVVDHLP